MGEFAPYFSVVALPFHCSFCNVSTQTKDLMKQHLSGKGHKKAVLKRKAWQELMQVEVSAAKCLSSYESNLTRDFIYTALPFHCSICNVSTQTKDFMKQHLSGKGHKKAVLKRKTWQELMQIGNIGISPTEGKKKVPGRSPMPSPVSSKEGSTNSSIAGNVSSDDDKEVSKAEHSLLQKVVRKGLIVSKNDIEVQRKDPNSPLYSVKTFEALHLKAPLLRGVYEMGFNAPSKIQETALPTLLADPPQNMIAQSQSGTGKTAAFVLAMLSRVDPTKNYPQVLCLSPTYELAIQIGDVAMKMGQFMPDIKIRFAIRGEDVPRGTQLLEQIIIGTPGKVVDWALKFRFFELTKIRVFVLDEADVMIATQGHQDQSFRIRKALSNQCQMMFFSATYDEDVMEFAEAIVTNPVTIRLKREEESLDNIKQYYVNCQNQDAKYSAISNIYGVVTIGQAIIFCHTRKTASWLSEKMTRDGHAVALLSGELTVEQRIAILDRFREGKEKVLITTNVLSRGIDIEQVTIVVNFDLPMDQFGRADCETYLHRIGRTGRFGKCGLAINLVDGPQSRNVLKQIQEHFGKTVEQLNTDDLDEIEKIGSE